MSDDVKWIIGIGVPIILALGGVIWAMLRSWIDRSETAVEKALGAHRANVANIEARFEQWTKDKENQDREWRHDEYNRDITGLNAQLFPLIKQVEVMVIELDKLREWRHVKGDAYVGAVDVLKDRVDRIEARMNGFLRGKP